jgi:endonuclease G, mitochondrial
MKKSKLYFTLLILLCTCLSCNISGKKTNPFAKAADGDAALTDTTAAVADDEGNPVSGSAMRTTALAADDHLAIPAPLRGVPEKIIRHRGYTLSYNSANKIPNWVAWKLFRDRNVQNYARYNKFMPDPTLPADEAVTTEDYKKPRDVERKDWRWDRGHMCPAADNTWDWRAMQECFYLTNMCPQHNNLNRGDWKELEDACRKWAEADTLYIVCGPILYKKAHQTIGEHKVVVPEAFYKCVLVLGKHPRAIGFIYKNNQGNHPLDSYVNSVDEVERITGINFYASLPDNIENKVEAMKNLSDWPFPEK